MNRNRNAAAWRLIFADPPKYTKSYRPRNLPNAPAGYELPDTEEAAYPTSPYSRNGPWGANNNKKYTVAMVRSEAPLTNAQHNRLLRRLENVTAL